jgi:hypothetical protein
VVEALGNIGDFIGGIGVVATLLYLAVQVRQNSKSVRSASAQAMLSALSQTITTIGASHRSAWVFTKGQLDPDGLSEDEAAQFAHQILGWFRVIEQAFYQHRLGGLDSDLWNGYVAQVDSLVQSPGVQRWWSVRGPVFHAEFREFIDRLQSNPSVPSGAATLDVLLGRTPADAQEGPAADST